MTDQPKPERQNGDGLCSDCPPVGHSHRTRCLPCPRREFPTTQEARATPTRDGAEGAGNNLAEYHNWAEYLRKVVAPKCDPFDRGELLKIADFISAPPVDADNLHQEALAIATSIDLGADLGTNCPKIRKHIAGILRGLAVPSGARPAEHRWLNDLIKAAEAFRAAMVSSAVTTKSFECCRALESALDPLNYRSEAGAAEPDDDHGKLEMPLRKLETGTDSLYRLPVQPGAGEREATAQDVMDSRNKQFGFAWDLNEAICDAIDAGKTESRDIAARVTTNPKIKEWLKLLPTPSRQAPPSSSEGGR